MTSIDFSPAQSAQEKPAATIFDQLEQRIKKHETIDQDRGLIEKGLSLLYSSDETSLANLKQLRQQAQQVKADSGALAQLKIEDAIKEDERSTGWQNDISLYGAGLIKGVPLFMAKGKGLLLAAGTNGLDQVRTSTSAEQMAVDFTLGAGKGVILKKSIEHFGASSAPMWQKGVTLGGSMSLAETALTSKTWYDSNSGNFHIKEGLGNTALSTTLGAATGAAVFPIGGKILERIGATTIGAEMLQNSGLARNIATGGSFGFVSGSVSETVREVQAGERIDPLKIVSRGILQGVVDMGAGAGGHKLSYMGRTGESGRTNFDWSRSPEANSQTETQFPAPRMFKILGGEKVLTEALRQVDGDGAMVTAREWKGASPGWKGLLGIQQFGTPVNVFIKHRATIDGIGPRANTADLIASCNLEHAFRNKAVMPTGADVFMQSGKDRVRFSTETLSEGADIKKLGSILPFHRFSVVHKFKGQDIPMQPSSALHPNGEILNNYVKFKREADGKVMVRGRFASDGIWTQMPLGKPVPITPNDVIYFGGETAQSANLLKHMVNLKPGDVWKFDNRIMGRNNAGGYFLQDDGSPNGTFLHTKPGYYEWVYTENKVVHLGRFGVVELIQPDAHLLGPVVKAGVPPVIAKPGVPPVIAKPGVPPVIAKPGVPPVIAKPGVPPVIANPHTPPVIAKPGTPPPVVANPNAPQTPFRPAPARPVANPNNIFAPEVKPLNDFALANGFNPDSRFRVGDYGQVVLSTAAGGMEPVRGKVTPVYKTQDEARSSARFIAGIFRRRLADPNDKSDKGPATWTSTDRIVGKDGKTYFVPVVGFVGGAGGPAVLTPDAHLRPDGFLNGAYVEPVIQRKK